MNRFVYLLILLLLTFTITSAQAQGQSPTASPNVEREIIIQFMPGTVSLPVGRVEASIDEITFKVPAIQAALRRFNATGAAKAFPRFQPADTLGRARSGEIVRLADLSEIYKITLTSSARVNEAINALVQLTGVVFAERNGQAVSQVYPNDSRFDNPSN